MQIHVISLKRTPERLERFVHSNAHLKQLLVCNAVDGHAAVAGLETAQREALMHPDVAYSPAAIGCALSHRALWIRCMESNQPLTICEDDALLHTHFEPMSQAFLTTLPADWDMVMWGWNFDAGLLAKLEPAMGQTYMKFDPTAVARHQATYRSTAFTPAALRVHMAFGLMCYSLSPSGAAKLLKGCFPLQPFVLNVKAIPRKVNNFGIDVATNRLYPSMNVWCPFPPLALSENDQTISTIQGRDA